MVDFTKMGKFLDKPTGEGYLQMSTVGHVGAWIKYQNAQLKLA